MPGKRCAPCLSPEAKRLLLESYPDAGAAIRAAADCPPGVVMDLCARKRSAYQEFVGECMRAKKVRGLDPEAMKDCARQWRERKPV